MSGHVIAIANTKGGVGKTLTTVALATTFCGLDLSVAIIDADPQQHSALFLQRRAAAAGESMPLDETVWSHDGVTLVRDVTEDSITKTIRGLRDSHEIVLIDLQGSANQSMLMAMGRANLVIIPCQPGGFDGTATLRTVGIAKSAEELVEREIPVRVLLTRTSPSFSTKADSYIREQLEGAGIRVLRTELMERAAFKHMSITGKEPSPDVPSERNAAANLAAVVNEIVLVLQGREDETVVAGADA